MDDIIRMLELIRDFRFVKNASPSWESEGSMLQYWKEQTGRDLRSGWICPKCNEPFTERDLHGAHVVYAGRERGNQYIIPLCAECNERRGQQTFVVRETDLVPAPRNDR